MPVVSLLEIYFEYPGPLDWHRRFLRFHQDLGVHVIRSRILVPFTRSYRVGDFPR